MDSTIGAGEAEVRARPSPDDDATLRKSWVVISVVALVSSVASLVVYAAHVHSFFMGDDFELIGDALAGVSPLTPVSTHLRPIIRLHFLLYRWIPSPEFFSSLSLLLHVLACGSVFVGLRATRGVRVAAPVALLFFSSFLANEAVFWAASAGVLYCMIFAGLSLACFAKGRLTAAYVWMVLAALSYEMWLVLPLLFLLRYRRKRELVLPFAAAMAYVLLHVVTFGGDAATAYGGFSLRELPVRFGIYAFRLLSPLEGEPSLAASLALSSLILALGAFRTMRLPVVLYASSALIFSLSAHVASRFYYFPSLALILLIVSAGVSPRRGVRVVGAALAVYLALASPWINSLDGDDYARSGDLHRALYDSFAARLDQMGEGESGIVINRMGPDRLVALARQRVGRPKLTFVRGPAMAGMIYPDDAVRMALWQREERPERDTCSGRTIEVGREGDVRSTYCFRIARR